MCATRQCPVVGWRAAPSPSPSAAPGDGTANTERARHDFVRRLPGHAPSSRHAGCASVAPLLRNCCALKIHNHQCLQPLLRVLHLPGGKGVGSVQATFPPPICRAHAAPPGRAFPAFPSLSSRRPRHGPLAGSGTRPAQPVGNGFSRLLCFTLRYLPWLLLKIRFAS